MVSVTCGATSSDGRVVIHVDGVSGGAFASAETQIPAGTNASDKCRAVADALNRDTSQNLLFFAHVSGNTIDISSGRGGDIGAVTVDVDSTGETTSISSILAPGQLVRLDQLFAPNPAAIPPNNTFFSTFFVNTPIFGTAGASADGVHNSAFFLNTLDANFQNRFGINLQAEPITDGSQQIGWRSSIFDPTTVTIGWDGNTARYLANFGLELQPPSSIPEPATLALLGIGVAGLAASRRRKLQ